MGTSGGVRSGREGPSPLFVALALAVTLAGAVSQLGCRRQRIRDWSDDVDAPVPASPPITLQSSRVLELWGDESEFDVASLDSPSTVVFGSTDMWLSGEDELTRVPLDGAAIDRLSVPMPIQKGTLTLVGDELMWTDRMGTGRGSAGLHAVASDLSTAPSLRAEFGTRWGSSSRPLLVWAEHLIIEGVLVDDELFPSFALAAVPLRGGEPRFRAFPSTWCNAKSSQLTGLGDHVLVVCTWAEGSIFYEVEIPSLELRELRRQDAGGPWSPEAVAVVGDAIVLVGGTNPDRDITIKRLDPEGKLQTLTTWDGEGQPRWLLLGDGAEAFLYCRDGSCGPGKMLWFSQTSWAPVPDAPRDASRLGFEAGTLHWQRREGQGIVLEARYPWEGPPLQARPSLNPYGMVGGITGVTRGR